VQDAAVRQLRHRHQVLAAQLPDGAAVARVVVDPFDRDALQAGGDGHPLDVGRERDPVNPH
jgi:hypothetical protein